MTRYWKFYFVGTGHLYLPMNILELIVNIVTRKLILSILNPQMGWAESQSYSDFLFLSAVPAFT